MRPIAIKSGLRRNCLCAGSSALMLFVAHNRPEYWYLSLIAFVPFLWRLLQLNLRGAICLATTLATLFVLATEAGLLSVSPGPVLIKLLAFNIAFILFAFGVNRAKKRSGFDPLMIALLWFPIEYVLITYADVGSVFSVPDAGFGAAVSFCTLFGFAMGSLVIVLINALILWLFQCIVQRAATSDKITSSEIKVFNVHTDTVTLERGLYYLLCPRAPPHHLDLLKVSY